MNKQKIELGDRVKDRITGLQGIAVGITDWLYGCRRVSVQPEKVTNGKPADAFGCDEEQLVIVKKSVIVPPEKAAPVPHPGGPRQDAIRRDDARPR